MSAEPHLLAVHREQLVHALHEAAELEHTLMCTYLYAAFSLRDGDDAGVSAVQADALARWKRTIVGIAVEEMGHLAQVWNVTAALGAAPRFGRPNFPLDPGCLPASVVVKLAPFDAATLQHFIHLERPLGSDEPDGEGFAPAAHFERSHWAALLTPMSVDYETVGEFYAALTEGLETLCHRDGEDRVFRGDPARQLDGATAGLPTVRPVRGMATAREAFDAIVAEGEGSRAAGETSHYQRFAGIRAELEALRRDDPAFEPAWPAATNPVLRRPPSPEGRVWIEDAEAIATVDLANATYGLLLRLLAYAYAVPAGEGARDAAFGLAFSLMHAFAPLAEHAARLPAGASHGGCHAGVSFTALRDAASWPVGPAAEAFFRERLQEIASAAAVRAGAGTGRLRQAADRLAESAADAERAWPADDAARLAGRVPPAPRADASNVRAT